MERGPGAVLLSLRQCPPACEDCWHGHCGPCVLPELTRLSPGSISSFMWGAWEDNCPSCRESKLVAWWAFFLNMALFPSPVPRVKNTYRCLCMCMYIYVCTRNVYIFYVCMYLYGCIYMDEFHFIHVFLTIMDFRDYVLHMKMSETWYHI